MMYEFRLSHEACVPTTVATIGVCCVRHANAGGNTTIVAVNSRVCQCAENQYHDADPITPASTTISSGPEYYHPGRNNIVRAGIIKGIGNSGPEKGN